MFKKQLHVAHKQQMSTYKYHWQNFLKNIASSLQVTFSFVVVQITQCAINYTRFDGIRGKISPRNFKFVDAKYTLCGFGTRKTPTRMIPPEQFPPGKAPPRITPTWKIPTWKTPTQDNSHLENSHPDYCNPENSV